MRRISVQCTRKHRHASALPLFSAPCHAVLSREYRENHCHTQPSETHLQLRSPPIQCLTVCWKAVRKVHGISQRNLVTATNAHFFPFSLLFPGEKNSSTASQQKEVLLNEKVYDSFHQANLSVAVPQQSHQGRTKLDGTVHDTFLLEAAPLSLKFRASQEISMNPSTPPSHSRRK